MRLLKALQAFLSLFDHPTVSDDDFPREEQWWNPIERLASEDERTQLCKHCGQELGSEPLKVCPQCGVALHAACYEDTEGGRAYATEGCSACYHRTYWR